MTTLVEQYITKLKDLGYNTDGLKLIHANVLPNLKFPQIKLSPCEAALTVKVCHQMIQSSTRENARPNGYFLCHYLEKDPVGESIQEKFQEKFDEELAYDGVLSYNIRTADGAKVVFGLPKTDEETDVTGAVTMFIGEHEVKMVKPASEQNVHHWLMSAFGPWNTTMTLLRLYWIDIMETEVE